MKNIIAEVKNSICKLNGKIDSDWEWIHKLEDRVDEPSQKVSGRNKEMKNTRVKLIDMEDRYVFKMKVLEEEGKKSWKEGNIWKKWVKQFPEFPRIREKCKISGWAPTRWNFLKNHLNILQ